MDRGIMCLHHPSPRAVVSGDTFARRPIGSQGSGHAQLFGELASSRNGGLGLLHASQTRWARWHGQHVAIRCPYQLPAALVRHPMVSMAQEDHVRQIGLAAVDPVNNVVRIAPGCGPFAARPFAMTVARIESTTPGAGYDATGAADVDHDRLRSQHDAGDGAVACET